MRRLFSLITVVLLYASAASAATIGKDRLKLARTQTAKGDALVLKTEYAGAEKKYRTAIETEPLLPTAYLGLGKALIGQQRYGEALVALAEAEKKFVEWEQTIQIAEMQKQQLAERQLQTLRDIQGAVSDKSGFRNADAADPGKAVAGQLTPEKIESESFLFRENRALEGLDAIPSQVFYLEGIAYLRTNRRALGIEALEVCLLINSGHELAHYNLAVALFTQGDLVEAKSHLDAAVAGGVEPHKKFVADLEGALSSLQVARGGE